MKFPLVYLLCFIQNLIGFWITFSSRGNIYTVFSAFLPVVTVWFKLSKALLTVLYSTHHARAGNHMLKCTHPNALRYSKSNYSEGSYVGLDKNKESNKWMWSWTKCSRSPIPSTSISNLLLNESDSKLKPGWTTRFDKVFPWITFLVVHGSFGPLSWWLWIQSLFLILL